MPRTAPGASGVDRRTARRARRRPRCRAPRSASARRPRERVGRGRASVRVTLTALGARAHAAHSPKMSTTCSASLKPCMRGGAVRPLLDVGRLDLDGQSARAADQVVVVARGRARAVEALALRDSAASRRRPARRVRRGRGRRWPGRCRCSRRAASRAGSARSRSRARRRALRARARAARCCAGAMARSSDRRALARLLASRSRHGMRGRHVTAVRRRAADDAADEVDDERDGRDVRAHREGADDREEDAADGRDEAEQRGASSGTASGPVATRIAAAAGVDQRAPSPAVRR